VEQGAADLLIPILIVRRGRDQLAEQPARRALSADLAASPSRIEGGVNRRHAVFFFLRLDGDEIELGAPIARIGRSLQRSCSRAYGIGDVVPAGRGGRLQAQRAPGVGGAIEVQLDEAK